MYKISLAIGFRRGKNSFEIVLRDSRSKRDTGNSKRIGFIENDIISYDKDLFNHWISLGAQPTNGVKKRLLGISVK